MVVVAARSRASKSRRNSLTVSAISPVGRGSGVAFDRRWRRPGRRGRAWPGWSSGARRSSGGPGAGPGREAFGGLEGFLDAPALPGHARPGWAAAPGAGCSSAGRPARRCGRCGGSADGARPGVGCLSASLASSGDPGPRVEAGALGCRHRQSSFCHARAGSRAGSASTRIGPACGGHPPVRRDAART